MNKRAVFIETTLLVFVLQLTRTALEYLMRIFVSKETFALRMTTMVAMALLAGGIILYARMRKVPLSLFPVKFNRRYIIATIVFCVLFITTPSNFIEGFESVMLLFYGSVVTPIFEELTFRGYIWNRMKGVFARERDVYLWNTAFFALWHLGYMMPQLLSGNLSAVLWKMAAGLGYGLILGYVRIKTQNCYSTILVHGILNIFMI